VLLRASATQAAKYGSRVTDPALPYAFASERRTERMILRPYERGDLESFHDLFGREDVSRYIPFGPLDLEQARAKLEKRTELTRIEADGDGVLLAAVQEGSGRMIGEFMLRLRSAESRQGEVGWTIHPDVQGRGLATEGAREMLRLGFEELRLHRIIASADARNTASLRVMERLGMRREATFVDAELFRGEWIDEIVYAVLESEWRAPS